MADLQPSSMSPPTRRLGDYPEWRGLIARHTLGVLLLTITVLLWTGSSFLASTIFADNTYSKPYFVTYFTTAMFSFFLLARIAGRVITPSMPTQFLRTIQSNTATQPIDITEHEREAFLSDEPATLQDSLASRMPITSSTEKLDVRSTVQLSLEFGFLWFIANFFQSKSLEYTSVASATILFSTSPIWTLIYGSWTGVETFTLKKLLGVFGSLAGVALVALGDLSGDSDKQRGKFPHKSPREIAVGDLLALASAVLYGIYTTRFKKRVQDESRVDMLLFLGCVGVANTLLLWPGLFLLDLIGLEKLEWPDTGLVTEIILINAAISVFSDLTWAYSVCLTTPLVVTVGLSLAIPLSIIGQLLINAQGSSIAHWIGAVIVVVAFILVNKEEREESESHIVRERRE